MILTTLNQTHPDYRKDELGQLEGLYCGGHEWRERIDVWIPRNTSEPADLCAERKKRAVYHNHAGPIVDLIAAWLFSEPPTTEGLDEEWLKNVDRRRTDWTPFWKELFTDALVYQRAYCWVNLPARPDGLQVQNRAEEEALGLLRPYLVPLEAEEVIDWGEDDAGALAWVMIRQNFQARASVAQGRQCGIRWVYVDSTRIQVWEWLESKDKKTPDDKDIIPLKSDIEHGIGMLPIVCLELPEGLHAMGKLHDPAVALLRASNDLDWALHRANHALMTVTTKDGIGPIKMGAGYFVALNRDKDGKDEVGYAEPSGATFTASSDRIKDLREELYRVVQAMALAVSPNAQAQSGESKARDWQAMEVILSAYAGLVLEAMLGAGQIVAKILKTSDPTVSGLDGWQQEDLETLLTQITTVIGLEIPSPTLKRELQKRVARRLLADAPSDLLRKIAKEIDEAPDEPSMPAALDTSGDTTPATG